MGHEVTHEVTAHHTIAEQRQWGAVFPDPRLVAVIVDRVTFNAHLLETGTQSCRLRTSKSTSSRTRAG